MLKFNLRLLLLSAALLYTGCDIDRFTSFDHSAKKLQETIKVEGEVTDFNTHTQIPRVLVQVGSQQTKTGLSGKFSVNHILTEDDQYSRPVKISLSRHKYYPGEYEEVLIPGKTNFNYSMQRAAPMIDTTVVVQTAYKEDIVKYKCQAIVKDYQGAHTINTVLAGLTFTKPHSDPVEVSVSLQRTGNVSATESHWEAAFSQLSGRTASGRYWFMAFDDEQFVDTLYVRKGKGADPNLLF